MLRLAFLVEGSPYLLHDCLFRILAFVCQKSLELSWPYDMCHNLAAVLLLSLRQDLLSRDPVRAFVNHRLASLVEYCHLHLDCLPLIVC